MDFIPLKLENIGAGSDAGTVIEQIESELAAIAREVMDDDHYEEKGAVVLKLEILRHGDGVVIGPKVTAQHPGLRRKSTMAYVNAKGDLVAQKGHQLSMLKDMVQRGEKTEAVAKSVRAMREAMKPMSVPKLAVSHR